MFPLKTAGHRRITVLRADLYEGLLALAILFVAVCNATTYAAEALDSSYTEIPWFNGSIEQAFAHARETGKPLFLYWGAVWCPPCEEIKQTVFKHPAFLAQTQLFVPVYLDGDTERAQFWGDYYAVAGYPTMVLFSPTGEELIRIPGGIETQRYINVFQSALAGLKSTAQLLQLALTTPERVGKDDFTQLAFYSWEQANLPTGSETGTDTFKQLAHSALAANNGIAYSRLYFHYLDAALAHGLSAEDKNQAQVALLNILADETEVLANIDYMVYYAQDIVPLVAEAGEPRLALTRAWTAAMDRIRFSPALSSAEQLATWYPQLHLYWINHADAKRLPEDVLRAVLGHARKLDEKTQGNARQTVINKVYQVLQAAHLYDESRRILLAEIEKSHSPYYFMSGLASLEEELGNKEGAVHWLQQAYEDSRGKATRFQWGVEYVDGLIRLQPRDSTTIATTAAALLLELDSPQDVLTGRNFGRLQTLLKAINAWRGEHSIDPDSAQKLANFFGELRDLCQSAEVDSAASHNCVALQGQLIPG